MKTRTCSVLSLLTLVTLAGCAGQTTDPRQGGLFSYNPKAYEQRLEERKQNLDQIEQSTQEAQTKSSQLEAEKTAQEQEKAELEAKLQELSAATASLEKDIRGAEVKTAAQNKERERILGEIQSLKSSFKLADEMEDPEEKRLELERLNKRRDELEKEAAKLMLL